MTTEQWVDKLISFGFGLVGALAGVLAAHWLSRDREHQARRRDVVWKWLGQQIQALHLYKDICGALRKRQVPGDEMRAVQSQLEQAFRSVAFAARCASAAVDSAKMDPAAAVAATNGRLEVEACTSTMEGLIAQSEREVGLPGMADPEPMRLAALERIRKEKKLEAFPVWREEA